MLLKLNFFFLRGFSHRTRNDKEAKLSSHICTKHNKMWHMVRVNLTQISQSLSEVGERVSSFPMKSSRPQQTFILFYRSPKLSLQPHSARCKTKFAFVKIKNRIDIYKKRKCIEQYVFIFISIKALIRLTPVIFEVRHLKCVSTP